MSGSFSGKTKSGLLYTGGSTILRNLLQIISVSVLSRILTPSDFGVYSIILVIYSFVLMFSELGLTSSIIQKSNINSLQLSSANIASIILGVFFSGLLFIGAPAIESIFRTNNLEYYVKIFSIVFVLRAISMVHEAFLRKSMKFKTIILIETLSFVLGSFSISLILALNHFGVVSIVLGLLAQVLIMSLLTIYFSEIKLSWKFNWLALRSLLGFGVPFTFGRLFMYLANQGDNLIIGKFLGSASLGFYNRSFQLMRTPVELLGGTLAKVLFPAFSRVKDNRLILRDVYLICVYVNSLFTLPLAAFLFYNAEGIIYILLGDQWGESILPFKVLVIALFFRVGYKFIDPLINATGNPTVKSMIQLIYAILVIGGAYLGSFYGLVEVTITVTLAVIIHYCLMSVIAIRELALNFMQVVKEGLHGSILCVAFILICVGLDFVGDLGIMNTYSRFALSLLLLFLIYCIYYILYRHIIFQKLKFTKLK